MAAESGLPGGVSPVPVPLLAAAPSPSSLTPCSLAEAAITGPGVPEKLGDAPLRLIIVGHNPSEHAWRSGHYYSNPSNRMWPILIKTGIAPPGTSGPQADDGMPSAVGVGFCDVGCGTPGTDSSQFSSADFEAWSGAFYERLRAHCARASRAVPGCACGMCGAPTLIAFSGKRQYLELLNIGRGAGGGSAAGRGRNVGRSAGGTSGKVKSVEAGPQALRPHGWPLPQDVEVWVCSSTSGASALTNEVREAPWRALADRVKQVEWPRQISARCGLPPPQSELVT